MNWAIWGPVIGSVLTGLITLVGVLSANNAQRKVSETKQDARMDALEAKQDANHRETVAAINALIGFDKLIIGIFSFLLLFFHILIYYYFIFNYCF